MKMKNKCGMRIAECGIKKKFGMRKLEFGIQFRTPHSALRTRLGMTLIELMVVVVILVTLVAGVLPLVSPNNDARKIGEASRALQTYFMQAQAEAARIGRPVGVGFRESSVDSTRYKPSDTMVESWAAGSGVALEAFQMQVPPVYPGSSTLSRVDIVPLMISPTEPELYNGSQFKSYLKAPLYRVNFQSAMRDSSGAVIPDPIPTQIIQVGDIIEAQGNRFVTVDDVRNGSLNTVNETTARICIRLDEVLQGTRVPPLAVPPGGYTYGIHRQPMGDERTNGSPKERIIVSGEPPFQFPAGVAVDLVSSGFEAGEMRTIFDTDRPNDNSEYLKYTSGIMFSPNGVVDSVWVNGQRFTDASRVFFLLGRVENGNPDFDTTYNFTNTSLSDEEFRDRQSKVNWLNLDSRWLMINGNDGRLTFHQNALVDPRTNEDDGTRDDDPLAAREAQIEAAHGVAHGHHEEEDVRQ